MSQTDISRSEKRQLEGILLNWPTVCTDDLGQTSVIKHQIVTTDSIPVWKRPYLVPINKQKFIDEEIESMLNKGIIRPSTSPWAAPIVLVPKKDGSVRFCVDYQSLNAKTSLDGFPMPQIQDILESMYGASVFSTLDLRSGYWQVMMDDCSIQKTIFGNESNQYELIRLPFGLKNAGATFQRLMNRILKGLLGKCCFVYIDDIVVYSKDVQQHIKDLKAVFCEMEAGGLTLNLKKCNLCKKIFALFGTCDF